MTKKDNVNSFYPVQVDDPEDDIDDSLNYPDIGFLRSAEDIDGEPFPDANISVSWQVPDGGIKITLILF